VARSLLVAETRVRRRPAAGRGFERAAAAGAELPRWQRQGEKALQQSLSRKAVYHPQPRTAPRPWVPAKTTRMSANALRSYTEMVDALDPGTGSRQELLPVQRRSNSWHGQERIAKPFGLVQGSGVEEAQQTFGHFLKLHRMPIRAPRCLRRDIGGGFRLQQG
jgi:hypothetical protein